jgi:branched-chain amino acid transport system substrate-binding protein
VTRGTDPAGAELHAYAATPAWAEAVEVVHTSSAAKVARVLHAQRFGTVLDQTGFVKDGEVTGIESFTWYVWTQRQVCQEGEGRV